jgi:hypothetical protein
VDDVAIVDHMVVFAVSTRPTPSKTQDLSTADQQFDAIVEQACPQPLLDQARHVTANASTRDARCYALQPHCGPADPRDTHFS